MSTKRNFISADAATVTASYARTHDAFIEAAQSTGLIPFDVRLLVALHERGGAGRTDQLERELLVDGSAIRRSSLTLRERGLILADAGEGTDRPRRGVRARLTLTAKGKDIARAVLDLVPLEAVA